MQKLIRLCLSAITSAAWLLVTSPTAEAQTVVAAARSAIGKPYAWGATGPNRFDCSGLVVWSYEHIGMTLPRTSQEQAVHGQPVTRGHLQPGDVITYYPDASHVALYVGNGQVIHASTWNVPVKQVALDNAGPFHNARRYLRRTAPVTDTLFADVSEFQCPVNDSYPYKVLSIRSNDGTYRDHNFAANYQWCVRACNEGRLEFFIVYFYWRPGSGDIDTHIAMVQEQGGPHPRMVSMMDIEHGDGNPDSDQSSELTAEYHRLQTWLGNEERVIGYANVGDERTMWQFKPPHVPFILAGYGSNPTDPGVRKLAHQYTDGTGFSPSLPQGCSPFGHCDMNSADGLSASQFAAACGIGAPSAPSQPSPTGEGFPMALSATEQVNMMNTVNAMAALVYDNNTQLRGPGQKGWPQLGQNAQGENLSLVDAVAALRADVDALIAKDQS